VGGRKIGTTNQNRKKNAWRGDAEIESTAERRNHHGEKAPHLKVRRAKQNNRTNFGTEADKGEKKCSQTGPVHPKRTEKKKSKDKASQKTSASQKKIKSPCFLWEPKGVVASFCSKQDKQKQDRSKNPQPNHKNGQKGPERGVKNGSPRTYLGEDKAEGAKGCFGTKKKPDRGEANKLEKNPKTPKTNRLGPINLTEKKGGQDKRQ